jgi:predicted small metal-binding protein
MRVLRCKDAGVDCDYEIRGETEEEIFRKAKEHAMADHGMKEIPAYLVSKMRSLINEE